MDASRSSRYLGKLQQKRKTALQIDKPITAVCDSPHFGPPPRSSEPLLHTYTLWIPDVHKPPTLLTVLSKQQAHGRVPDEQHRHQALLHRLRCTPLPPPRHPAANMEPLRPPAHPPGRRGGRRRARRPSPGAHLRRCPRPIAGRLFERASQSAAPGPRRLGRRARRLLGCGARAEGIRAGKALSWHGGRPRRMALLPAAGAVSRAWVPGRGCAAGRPGSWVELGHALEGCLTMPATPPRSDRELGLPAAEPSHLQAE